MKNTIDLTHVPVFLDGSDGSLWQARNTWEQLLNDPEIARKRFVKVSDLLAVLKDFNLAVGDAVGNVATEPEEKLSRHPTKFDNAGNLIPHSPLVVDEIGGMGAKLFEANKKDYFCPKCGTKEAQHIKSINFCSTCAGVMV